MNQSKIDLLFETIWSEWPNREKEHAARKAFVVFINSGGDYKELRQACETYILSSIGEDYTYQLNNFILQDHWKDILELIDPFKIAEESKRAKELCESWNNACRPHWCKIVDINSKMPMSKKALSNKFFCENWEKALDLARKIFKYTHNENDIRSKIIINFKWFTDVSPDRHVVSKIIEGDYGKPQRDISVQNKSFSQEKINWAKRKAVAEYFELLRTGKLEDESDEYYEKFIAERSGERQDGKQVEEEGGSSFNHPFD